jgi:hypothetical protein
VTRLEDSAPHPEVAAGDPFIAAGRDLGRDLRGGDCPSCFGGYVTITVEEDGQERDEAVPCRRCAALAPLEVRDAGEEV